MMLRKFLVVFVILILLLVIKPWRAFHDADAFDGAALTPSYQGTKMLWETNFERAWAQASQDGKPRLVFFAVKWCPHCKAMKQSTFSDSLIESATINMMRIYVDCEAEPEIAKRFNVHSYPVTILFDSTGKKVRSFKGRASPNDFLAWVSR